MDEKEATALTEALLSAIVSLGEIVRTAARNAKSLSGTGPYAERFHGGVLKLTQLEKRLLPGIGAIPDLHLEALKRSLAIIKLPHTTPGTRDEARRQAEMICHTEILPNLSVLTTAGPARPRSEGVLAAVVLADAPEYMQRTLLQANGCYEMRWFEACSVMIRKLIENLIIEVYERNQKQAEISSKDGDYLMLHALVSAILAQSHWPLERETKRSLPELKVLGDRGAHKRRYHANQQDVDKVLTGLRATVDDLLHLARYK
jgi:hypothetical protein